VVIFTGGLMNVMTAGTMRPWQADLLWYDIGPVPIITVVYLGMIGLVSYSFVLNRFDDALGRST
jgi:hypothetical protein